MGNLGYDDFKHEARRIIRGDLLEQLNDTSQAPPATSDEEQGVYISSMHGERVIDRALQEWRKEVVEPAITVEEGPILNDYIHQGIKWTWVREYKNKKFAWCGAFCGFCWIDISPDIRKKSFPSTYRLQEWAKGSRRIIKSLSEARKGDIVIVGFRKPWGDHITLLDKLDKGGFWSVEGNAYGETPTGERREGVIRRFRREEEINVIYRPLKSDLEDG